MNIREALTILGLSSEHVNNEEIKAAAAASIKKCHPDHGGDPELAPETIAKIQKAKSLLLQRSNDDSKLCGSCGGKGYKQVLFQTFKCVRCQGTGVTHG